MPGRKVPLITNHFYHILSRSIANYTVFRTERDFRRMRQLLRFYQLQDPPFRFSHLEEMPNQDQILDRILKKGEKLVEIIAYCIMPNHLHLLLRQRKEDGISRYMSNVLNSYTRYFNLKSGRKGPLWEGRFKNVEVESNKQLQHLTRYIHLNPVTAYLVENPEDWEFSSYREYIGKIPPKAKLCQFRRFLTFSPSEYQKFVLSQKQYQRELAQIKAISLE